MNCLKPIEIIGGLKVQLPHMVDAFRIRSFAHNFLKLPGLKPATAGHRRQFFAVERPAGSVLGLAVEDQRGLRRESKLLPVFFDARRQKVEGFRLGLNYAGFRALS